MIEVPAFAGTDVCLPLASSRSKLSGWIILDKPSGITSAHAVARVKKIVLSASCLVPSEEKTRHKSPGTRHSLKIGHAGTLDPLASGVLPLALGEATKTVPYMMDAAKAYTFTVTWGEERDTDDSEGKITQTSDKRPTNEEIMAILPRFTGKIQQTPPNYSAIKVDGKRAYDMAREGETVELKAREVRIERFQVSGSRFQENIETSNLIPQTSTSFEVACSKGTYIRSLARDMGRVLGCFGYISALRRIKVGKFDETHAISLEMLEEMVHKGDLGFLRAVESALDDILAIDVTQTQATQLKRGQNVVLPLKADSSTVIARSGNKLVAICEWNESRLKPVRVFNL